MDSGNVHIEGTVGHANGDVACEGDLRVDGNVLDGRAISAGGAIHVGGVIQAAQVTAGGSVVAKGGILGRHKAQCIIGGSLSARHIVRAYVKAGADIRVDNEIEGSTVIAGGDIVVTGGAIVGGQVTAMGDISCRRVGVHHARTHIDAGVDADAETEALSAMARVAACRDRAEKIRTIGESLLRLRKSLNPQQREKATELLFEADELETEMKQILDRLRENARKMRQRPTPVIEVAEIINTGVQIRCRHLEAIIDLAIPGPVRISLVDDGKSGHIVVTHRDGSTTDLKARSADCKGAQVLRQLAA